VSRSLFWIAIFTDEIKADHGEIFSSTYKQICQDAGKIFFAFAINYR
jgi:hypothetical protein